MAGSSEGGRDRINNMWNRKRLSSLFVGCLSFPFSKLFSASYSLFIPVASIQNSIHSIENFSKLNFSTYTKIIFIFVATSLKHLSSEKLFNIHQTGFWMERSCWKLARKVRNSVLKGGLIRMMTNTYCSVIYFKLFTLWMEAHFLPSSLLMRSSRASPSHRIMIWTQVIHPTFLLSFSRPLYVKRLNHNLKRMHGGGGRGGRTAKVLYRWKER